VTETSRSDGGRPAPVAVGFVRVADMAVRFGMIGAELCLVAMMVLISAEVVCRSFFAFSLTIVDETCGYLVVALLFLGVAHSLREQALLRVEFLINALPRRARPVVDLVYDTAALGFAVILAWQLYRITVSSHERGMIAPTLMETPIWMPQVVMPLGCALLILALLAEMARDVDRILRGGGDGDGAPPDARPAVGEG